MVILFYFVEGYAADVQFGFLLLVGIPVNLIAAIVHLLIRRKDFISNK